MLDSAHDTVASLKAELEVGVAALGQNFRVYAIQATGRVHQGKAGLTGAGGLADSMPSRPLAACIRGRLGSWELVGAQCWATGLD